MIDDLIFIDEAVTGKTHRRAGLQRLLTVLSGDDIDVLLTFATNRIYRKSSKSLQFVEEEILDRKKRCVFVSQNIDTNDKKTWQFVMQVFAMLDEMQCQMLVSQVRAGQEGLLLHGFVHGTISFGYLARPVDGRPTKQGNPRCGWGIDPEAAKCVVQVFNWFVNDRLGYAAIARRLRQAGVSSPPRAARWSRTAVKYLLMNRRYIGDWSYGWKEAVWQNRQGYSRQFKREEPLRKHQAESLRLVNDTLFFEAQERIAKYIGNGARPRRDGRETTDHLLRDLLWCPTHKRTLTTSGTNAHWMACADCRRSDAPELYSMVNRKAAERLLCKELARLVRADDVLVEMIVAQSRRQAGERAEADPTAMADTERRMQNLTQKISFVLDNPGQTETDMEENKALLKTLRGERAVLERQFHAAKASVTSITPPTDGEVRGKLDDLAAVLSAAMNDPEAAAAARAVVGDLTGGKIVMKQCGEARRHCGWLSGSFHFQLPQNLVAGGEGLETHRPSVTIDFKTPGMAEELADQAKFLYDEGKLYNQIAAELGVTKIIAREALRHWFVSRGKNIPDGRKRFAELNRSSRPVQRHQILADEVKRLSDQGLLLKDVAFQLEANRDTVTKAFKFWHESRGLTVPDGRSRRKTLAVKSSVKAKRTMPAATGSDTDSP